MRKRKFDYSSHEVGQSSRVRPSRTSHEVGRSTRVRPSRRVRNPSHLVPVDILPNPSYFDDGDCEFVCEYCSAYFWFAERIMRGLLHARPRYTHC
ncbi:hypothetical protein CASFOL_004362 [Castilleja foliolosa]